LAFIRMIGANVTVFHRGRILMEGPCETVLDDQQVRNVYLGRQIKHHHAA
jgi:ABC-type uncharacterized transport system ATPase subunit